MFINLLIFIYKNNIINLVYYFYKYMCIDTEMALYADHTRSAASKVKLRTFGKPRTTLKCEKALK